MEKKTAEQPTSLQVPELSPQQGMERAVEAARKLVCDIGGVTFKQPSTETLETDFIEQLDGHPNGEDDVIIDTVYDLTISSVTFHDSYCSIEENLCTDGNDVMIESISEDAAARKRLTQMKTEIHFSQ